MASNTNPVQVVEKNEGTKIEWRQNGKKIIFGDDDLSVRCDTRQKDIPNTVDICFDADGDLVIGTGTGRYYAAQIEIPAIQYQEVEDEGGEPGTHMEPIPLDMGDVTLVLWSIDHRTPAPAAE